MYFYFWSMIQGGVYATANYFVMYDRLDVIDDGTSPHGE